MALYSTTWCLNNLPYSGALETPVPRSLPRRIPTTDVSNPVVAAAQPREDRRAPLRVEVVMVRQSQKERISKMKAKNEKVMRALFESIRTILDTEHSSHHSESTGDLASASLVETAVVRNQPSRSPEERIQPELKIATEGSFLEPTASGEFYVDYSSGTVCRGSRRPSVTESTNTITNDAATPNGLREKKGVIGKLNELHQTVVRYARMWDCKMEAEGFIRALEEYKTVAVKQLRGGFEFENIIDALKVKIKKCKFQQGQLARRSKSASGRLTQPNFQSDKGQSDPAHVWGQVDHYLMGITPEVLDDFGRLDRVGLGHLHSPKLLSMYAVNRLAAILKMVKYCQDTQIDAYTFRAQAEALSKVGLRLPQTRGVTAGKSYMVDPGELAYLVGLSVDQLHNETIRLKALLLMSGEPNKAPESQVAEPEIEGKLQALARRNAELREKVRARVLFQRKAKDCVPDTSVLERQYKQLIPTMKRKRARDLQEEIEVMGALQAKHLQSEGESERLDFSLLEEEGCKKPDALGRGCMAEARTNPGSVTTTPPVQTTSQPMDYTLLDMYY
ncbi:MAG: hypothetical protein P4L10_16925 [Acidobacteriaceae bacterium]|nr:hypothetical protein [Acidobacteriaceae bacterium]